MSEPSAASLTAGLAALQNRLRSSLTAGLLALWRQLDATNPDAGYSDVEAAARVMLAASLLRTATAAPRYVADMLAAGGLNAEPQPLDPTAFAATTVDGRPLEIITRAGLAQTKIILRAGIPASQALASGFVRVSRSIVTEIHDVTREALAGSMLLEDQVQQYDRALNPPSCSRCFILAGIRSTKNTAFQRHPRCDCFQRPVIPGTPRHTAKDLWSKLTREQQDQMLGERTAQQVRDGASLNTVTRPALRNGGVSVRTAAERPVKMTPLAIREASHGDPQEYRRLMVAHGYLLG